jgi:hypothetical protein
VGASEHFGVQAMPKTGLAYERPSRASLALIVCFSLGLIIIAGWLVMMIMLSSDANTAGGPTDEMVASLPPRIENATPSYVPPLTVAAPQSTATPSDAPGGTPWPTTTLPLASAAASAPANTGPAPTGAYTTSALAVPDTAFRGPGDLLQLAPDPADEATEIVPLPLPRPRRMASVPVPRPRPQIDDAEPEPPLQKRSLLDIFINRQP